MRVLKSILKGINHIIPKSNTIIFNSYPPYSDNALALYNYIIEDRPDITSKYKILWGQETISTAGVMTKGIINPFIKKSPAGVWRFLRAKYIITTHGYFPGVTSGSGQTQINLWHGCGYKTITEADKIYRGDETIVTSDLYRQIHASIFEMDETHVHVTGYPRNDLLFKPSNALEKLGITSEYKIYIWLPTYRKAALGHDGIDGSENSFGIGTIDEQHFLELNAQLKKQGVFLIIKTHPMDTIQIDNVNQYSNIACMTNQNLKEMNVDLYDLLPCTDGLLSDYSSVIVDYLLLDKPIAMVLSDQEEYKNTRGFVFDPVEDYFPGPIINDFSGLLEYFQNREIIDNKWKEKREQLKDLFHKYSDDKSCERVCNLIWGRKI